MSTAMKVFDLGIRVMKEQGARRTAHRLGFVERIHGEDVVYLCAIGCLCEAAHRLGLVSRETTAWTGLNQGHTGRLIAYDGSTANAPTLLEDLFPGNFRVGFGAEVPPGYVRVRQNLRPEDAQGKSLLELNDHLGLPLPVIAEIVQQYPITMDHRL